MGIGSCGQFGLKPDGKKGFFDWAKINALRALRRDAGTSPIPRSG
jgi:hypothetical protein